MIKTGKTIICQNCNGKFYAALWEIINGRSFCSSSCHHTFTKGKPTWNRGKNLSKKHKEAISESHRGIKYPNRKSPIMTRKHKKNISNSLAGRKLSANHISKLSGLNSKHWKGNAVGYTALHDWVRKVLGKPITCEQCGRTGLTGRKIHWANKSGKYLRDTNDWIRLCSKCHCIKDGTINNLKHRKKVED